MPTRHPANVDGAWYTTGQCLACSVPEDAAPTLFAPLEGENWLTHFLRQPATEEEIEQACCAALGCCVADVRYGGRDPAVIRRLGNHPDYCDHVMAADGQLLPVLDGFGDVRAELREARSRSGGRGWFQATVGERSVKWWIRWR